jgi:hypothetical protein
VSVINKMLRDLDQRQTVQVQLDDKSGASALRRDTASVGAPSSLAQVSSRVANSVIVGLMLFALTTAGAFWLWRPFLAKLGVPVALQSTLQPIPAPQTVNMPAAVLATEAASATTTISRTGSASVSTELTTRVRSKINVPAKTPSVKVVYEPIASREGPTQAARIDPTSTKASTLVSHEVSQSNVALTEPLAVTSASVSGASPSAQVRHLQAWREALAQAQSLWNSGSHAAAVDLLQQVLVLAERSVAASASTSNIQLLGALAREHGRMLLADGKAQVALDSLTHLEPLLNRDADVWAMRGNVAQRLGRHQDSVQAYTTALQIHPNEQRWLLGAAVSLAALGQIANASEFAAKARAQGPIGKEVQSFLRQSGVPLIEP